MLRTLTLLSVSLLLVLPGCGSGAKSKSYQVLVRNESPRSVTVWLTKAIPSDEPGWRTPEDVAIANMGSREPVGGVIIPPGKLGETGKVSGKFTEQDDAVLRVYIGQLAFNDLLAVSKGSPNRIDVVLQPGRNELVVKGKRGAIIVDRADGEPAMTN
jgi:hypothetical protein